MVTWRSDTPRGATDGTINHPRYLCHRIQRYRAVACLGRNRPPDAARAVAGHDREFTTNLHQKLCCGGEPSLDLRILALSEAFNLGRSHRSAPLADEVRLGARVRGFQNGVCQQHVREVGQGPKHCTWHRPQSRCGECLVEGFQCFPVRAVKPTTSGMQESTIII